MMVLEFFECRVEGAKGVTEEAMIAVGHACLRDGADVMSAFVVRDCDRRAVRVAIAGMRDSGRAGDKAGEQQQRDRRAPQPRLATKHRFELSDWGWVSQATAR